MAKLGVARSMLRVGFPEASTPHQEGLNPPGCRYMIAKSTNKEQGTVTILALLSIVRYQKLTCIFNDFYNDNEQLPRNYIHFVIDENILLNRFSFFFFFFFFTGKKFYWVKKTSCSWWWTLLASNNYKWHKKLDRIIFSNAINWFIVQRGTITIQEHGSK